MLKRDITYENPLTGDKVTETHYFHISKTDLVEMEIEEIGGATYIAKVDAPESGIKAGEELMGMRAKLQRIQDSQDGKAILSEMKDMIRRAHGVREEGDRFIKNETIQKNFVSGPAYQQLLWDLCTDPAGMGEFFVGIFPSNLAEITMEVQEQAAKIQAGRDAQEVAKTAGVAATPTPEPVATMPEESTPDGNEQPSLADRIDAATAENPVTLTEAEVKDIDSDTLKSGLATGRVKIS